MYICTRTLRKVPVRLYTSWRLDILEWNVMITYGREWQDFLTCCSSRSRGGRTASTFGSLQHLPQISLSLLPSWYRSLVGSSTSCYIVTWLVRLIVRESALPIGLPYRDYPCSFDRPHDHVQRFGEPACARLLVHLRLYNDSLKHMLGAKAFDPYVPFAACAHTLKT